MIKPCETTRAFVEKETHALIQEAGQPIQTTDKLKNQIVQHKGKTD